MLAPRLESPGAPEGHCCYCYCWLGARRRARWRLRSDESPVVFSPKGIARKPLRSRQAQEASRCLPRGHGPRSHRPVPCSASAPLIAARAHRGLARARQRLWWRRLHRTGRVARSGGERVAGAVALPAGMIRPPRASDCAPYRQAHGVAIAVAGLYLSLQWHGNGARTPFYKPPFLCTGMRPKEQLF